jgi:hypothetical protein
MSTVQLEDLLHMKSVDLTIGHIGSCGAFVG